MVIFSHNSYAVLNIIKIVVYVPVASADAIRSVIAQSGYGFFIE